MSDDDLTKLLDRVLDQLGEHFSSVQIVCTKHEGGTKHYHRGVGDFYARRGAADKWLRDDDDEDRVFTQIKVEREEDRDDWEKGE